MARPTFAEIVNRLSRPSMPKPPTACADRARAAVLADLPVSDDDLAALVTARLAGRSWSPEAVAPEPVRTVRQVLTIRRAATANMTRPRKDKPLLTPQLRGRGIIDPAGFGPLVRSADPAEQADEEERRRLPVGALPPGFVVEAKLREGLGGWRSALVEEDTGGRKVKIKIGLGSFEVTRSHVRAPRETRSPRRVLAAVAHASAKLPPTVLPPLGAPVIFRSAQSILGRPRPKPKGRIRDGDFLRFVREHPCLSCGAMRGVHAHHHGPRPVGRKCDDYRTVPLCARCHDHLHANGFLLGDPMQRGGVAVLHLIVCRQVDLLIEWMGEAGDLLGEALDDAELPL